MTNQIDNGSEPPCFKDGNDTVVTSNNSKHKRARFFVRTNSKKALGQQDARHQSLRRLFLRLACLYALVNVISKSVRSGGGGGGSSSSSSRGLAAAVVQPNQGVPGLEDNDNDDDNNNNLAHHRPSLRGAVSSIYNKNSNPRVRIIENQDWQDHAYLPLPQVQVVHDDHVWPKAELTPAKHDEKVEITNKPA